MFKLHSPGEASAVLETVVPYCTQRWRLISFESKFGDLHLLDHSGSEDLGLFLIHLDLLLSFKGKALKTKSKAEVPMTFSYTQPGSPNPELPPHTLARVQVIPSLPGSFGNLFPLPLEVSNSLAHSFQPRLILWPWDIHSEGLPFQLFAQLSLSFPLQALLWPFKSWGPAGTKEGKVPHTVVHGHQRTWILLFGFLLNISISVSCMHGGTVI